MTNPDRRVHGSETCLALITLIVVLGIVMACVLMVADAYR